MLDGRVNPNHSLGSYLEYAKQVRGTLYGMADGTYLREDQFVKLPALHGAITLAPHPRPKDLFIAVEYKGKMKGYDSHEGYARWYLVLLKKYLRVADAQAPDTPSSPKE